MTQLQDLFAVDHLTGLPNIRGWVGALPEEALPVHGVLLGIGLPDLASVYQRFGIDAGDALFCEVGRRLAPFTADGAVLLRGTGHNLLLWLPGVTEQALQGRLARACSLLYARPLALPDGGELPVSAALFALACAAGNPAQQAVSELECALARQATVAAPPSGACSALEMLNRTLDGMRLFAQDTIIEAVLAQLKLPALEAETVIVLGEPAAGKARVLACLAKYLEGQAPLAEVVCRPSDQAVPFSLVIALLSRFLTAHSPARLRQALAACCRDNEWLATLFPMLNELAPAQPLPDALDVLHHGLRQALGDLAAVRPHLAVVHGIQAADRESLALLAEMQRQSGHGLRVIADADGDASALPAALQELITPSTITVALPALTGEQVYAYLDAALPEIAAPDVAALLYDASDGLPLALEAALRAWVHDGVLAFADGQWSLDRARLHGACGLPDDDRVRLAGAALIGPVALDLLAALWQTTPDDARATVQRARALGYLRAVDDADPERVEFATPDEAAALCSSLSTEQRATIHDGIARVLERSGARTPELAYHLRQAGDADRAQAYAEQMDGTLSSVLAALSSRLAPTLAGAPGWDIPPAPVVQSDDIPAIVATATAIRLAGVRCRLYPGGSELVRQAMRDAAFMLQQLLARRPSFTIGYDGTTVSFDGQLLSRREDQVMLKDYQAWMTAARLRAIGFLPGVNEAELSAFLSAIAVQEAPDELSERVQRLSLRTLKVLPAAACEPASCRPDTGMEPLPEIALCDDEALPVAVQQPQSDTANGGLPRELAAMNSEAALDIIDERLNHPDAAVRADALSAVVHIAGADTVTYLQYGLEDVSPLVRARAATLVAHCPDPVLAAPLAQLLHGGVFRTDEPEAVQLAACQGLGALDTPAAYEALIRVHRPTLFSSLRPKSDAVRAAAIAALAAYLRHPTAQEIMHEAIHDANVSVRQYALRAWQQYVEEQTLSLSA